MTPDDDIDRALREVPAAPPQDEAELDDGVLLAYRAGRLGPSETEAVEARLARDPEARALLRALAEPADALSVERLVRSATPRARPFARGLPALGVLAAVAASALFLLRPHEASRPHYEFEVEGYVAPTRSGTSKSTILTPDAQLVARLRPERRLEDPPQLGVFLVSGAGRLVRVQVGSVEARGGAFVFRALASELFSAPGSYVLLLHLEAETAGLTALEGAEAEKVETAQPGLGWWRVPVDYRAAVD